MLIDYDLVSRLLYLIFETILFLAAYRITRLFAKRFALAYLPGEAVIIVLSTGLILSALIGSAASFLKINSALTYFLTASAVLILCYKASLKTLVDDLRVIYAKLTSLSGSSGRILAVIVLSLIFIPPIIQNIKPVNDPDSILSLTSMLAWFHNQATPYTIVWYNSYPTFWELAYMPAMVITRSDHFIWWVTFKALVLFGFTIYGVSRLLNLSKLSSLLITISILTLRYFWWYGPPGISTNKNDIIVAAGVLIMTMAILAAGRQDKMARTGLFMMLSWPMLGTKYSGAITIALMTFLLVLFNLKGIRADLPRFVKWFVASSLLLLISSGHYYIRNFLAYQNPFNPVLIKVGSHTIFPGIVDLQGSDILSNIHDPRLWELIFASHSVGGFALPFVALTSPLVSLLIILYAIVRQVRQKRWDKNGFLIACIVLAGWLYYIRSFWSAGWKPGDFQYIAFYWMSLRYTLGTVALAEILLFYWFAGLTRNEWWPGLVFVASIAQRIWIIYHIPELYLTRAELSTWLLITGIVVGIFVVSLFTPTRRRELHVGMVAAATCFLLFGVPLVAESKRPEWWNWAYQDWWAEFWHKPPTTIALITGAYNWQPTYFAAGSNFQHQVKVYPEFDLQQITEDKPEYLLYFVSDLTRGSQEEVEKINTMIKSSLDIYTPLELNPGKFLMARRNSLANQETQVISANDPPVAKNLIKQATENRLSLEILPFALAPEYSPIVLNVNFDNQNLGRIKLSSQESWIPVYFDIPESSAPVTSTIRLSATPFSADQAQPPLMVMARDIRVSTGRTAGPNFRLLPFGRLHDFSLNDGLTEPVSTGQVTAIRFTADLDAAQTSVLRVLLQVPPLTRGTEPVYQLQAAMYFRRSDQPDFVPQQRLDFNVIADDQLHSYYLEPTETAGWSGQIAEVLVDFSQSLDSLYPGLLQDSFLSITAGLNADSCPPLDDGYRWLPYHISFLPTTPDPSRPITQGGTRAEITGPDPFVYLLLDEQPISANQVDEVIIQLKGQPDEAISTVRVMAGSLIFRPPGQDFDNQHAFNFTWTVGGGTNQVSLDLTSNPNWEGQISGLRLDPIEDIGELVLPFQFQLGQVQFFKNGVAVCPWR